jgi:hypothetical protein
MKYEIYHSNKSGNLMASSRTRKDAAVRVAEGVKLSVGERVVVLLDRGPMPGDYRRIYCRTK